MPVPSESTSSPQRTGFRVGISRPVLDSRISGRADGTSIENAAGVSLGYGQMPMGDLGWTTGLTYISGKASQLNASLIRGEINLAYGYDRIFSFRGETVYLVLKLG